MGESGEHGTEGTAGSWAPFWAKQGTTRKSGDLTWAFTRPPKTTVAGAQGAEATVRPWGWGEHCEAVETGGGDTVRDGGAMGATVCLV